MVLLLYAIIPCIPAIYTPCFSDFGHCHPYIFQQKFYYLFHWFFIVYLASKQAQSSNAA